MKIKKKGPHEELVEYVDRLSRINIENNNKIRKLKGQYFTPKQVSTFMAGLFKINQDKIRLLDPGAGTGVLSAAFCEKLLRNNKDVELIIDAYENDPNLLQILKTTLESCKIELGKRGHNVKYNIFEEDFILHNQEYFKNPDLFWNKEEKVLYDFIISNPPYYKLNKNSPQSNVMMELISGQPNIYAFFMALSARMLKPQGEMVFITPRSFCSGLYYKKFRKWLLNEVKLLNIHIFESRKEIFDKDKVLQENVIIKAKKLKKKNKNVILTKSKNKDLDDIKKIKVHYSKTIYPQNGDIFIRIPSSKIDVKIINIVDSWNYTLNKLGLEISTGPVVDFRAREYLLPDFTDNPKSAPLLWMHNMKDMKVIWPFRKNNKASAIKIIDETMPLLLPLKNYVLVKRFSSKEQKRRLYAAVLLKSEFQHDTIGIENHLNYIHKPKGDLSIHEAFGISAILNTAIIDNYFRSLNGHTQVNATDIRSLPFTNIENIKKIGKIVYESRLFNHGINLDTIVAEILNIDNKIIKELYKGEILNEQN